MWKKDVSIAGVLFMYAKGAYEDPVTRTVLGDGSLPNMRIGSTKIFTTSNDRTSPRAGDILRRRKVPLRRRSSDVDGRLVS